MTTLRFLVLCAALVGPGCIGGEEVGPAKVTPTPDLGAPEGDAPAPAPDAGPSENVTMFNGSIAGAGNPAVGYVKKEGENAFTFDVPEGVKRIVVEVAWAGGDALDVQLDVPSSYCKPIDPQGAFEDCPSPPPDSDGASPALIEVVEPDALARVGEWRLGVWARSSTGAVPFTATVTLVQG